MTRNQGQSFALAVKYSFLKQFLPSPMSHTCDSRSPIVDPQGGRWWGGIAFLGGRDAITLSAMCLTQSKNETFWIFHQIGYRTPESWGLILCFFCSCEKNWSYIFNCSVRLVVGNWVQQQVAVSTATIRTHYHKGLNRVREWMTICQEWIIHSFLIVHGGHQ